MLCRFVAFSMPLRNFVFVTLFVSDRLPTPTIKLPELIRRVSSLFSLHSEAMASPGRFRPIAEARGITAYLALSELGFKGIEVGKAINLTSAGATIAVKRGERLVRKREEFRYILIQLIN